LTRFYPKARKKQLLWGYSDFQRQGVKPQYKGRKDLVKDDLAVQVWTPAFGDCYGFVNGFCNGAVQGNHAIAQRRCCSIPFAVRDARGRHRSLCRSW
jgi:hypothetical protein